MKKTDVISIEFWNWFRSISNDLLLDPTRSDLIAQIDNRVSNLGVFDWEIGPWEEELYYFAISPNLDGAKLEITRGIVLHAPVAIGWHFLPSKPPKKDWQGIWKMKNELGKEILIDSNNWKYILFEFDDRTFDLDIMIDNVDSDNYDVVNMAIDIALTGYLGEEKFMKLIKGIKIVNSFEEEYQNKATLVKYIKKHIESIA